MEEEIKKYVLDGRDLVERARKYSISKIDSCSVGEMMEFIGIDYNHWISGLVKYLRKNNVDELAVVNIETADSLLVNPVEWALKANKQETRTEAIRLYIENVNRVIKELSLLDLKQKERPQIYDIRDVPLSYNEEISAITFNDVKIPIPANTKEAEFCKVLFKKTVGGYACWEDFFVEIDSEKEEPDKKDKKALRDVINRVNNRLSVYFGRGAKVAKFEKLNIVRIN